MKWFNRKNSQPAYSVSSAAVWARPEMNVTFRAEIMPGKTRLERTFKVLNVFANGRVTLYNFEGEHREGAFEPINFLREKAGSSLNGNGLSDGEDGETGNG